MGWRPPCFRFSTLLSLRLCRFPVPAIDELLIPLLNQYSVNKQTFTSAVLVASYVLSELVKRDLSPDEQAACQRVVIAVLPWSLSSYGSVRSMAHHTVRAVSVLVMLLNHALHLCSHTVVLIARSVSLLFRSWQVPSCSMRWTLAILGVPPWACKH